MSMHPYTFIDADLSWLCVEGLQLRVAVLILLFALKVVATNGLTNGPALDAWSLGCILAELALKRPLFPCNSSGQLLAQVCTCQQSLPSLPEIPSPLPAFSMYIVLSR